jgi:hypothetical protein
LLTEDIARALRVSGLSLRGGFRPDAQDRVPPSPDGTPVGTVLMVGNAGPAMWQRFAAERSDGPSPLDTWTRTVVTRVAEQFGAHAVYPFERPYLPFQAWSMRAEPCHASPIQMLIHPAFGLWHALRGALLFPHEIVLPERACLASPCDACRDRPCLSTCPVGALSAAGYDAPRCLAHLADLAGRDCLDLGCCARRACPVGSTYRYAPDQARFHMEGFRDAADGSLTIGHACEPKSVAVTPDAEHTACRPA